MTLHSPAAAIAWEFWQRHRWGFMALLGYVLVLVTIEIVAAQRGPVILDTPWRFALLVVVPLGVASMYLLALFSFGFSGDLAARQSIYPARMFTLPVSSAALTGWPMLYGTAVMAVLWGVTRLFAPWPSVLSIPKVWPMLLGVVLLAWTQALTWMPYGLPGLRVIVAVLWLATIDTVVLLALHFEARESVMIAILAPQVPLAYITARSAVARARRGVVPDWRGVFVRPGRLAEPWRRRERFASPAQAQAWLEWKRHGLSLPVWVGILLPFELGLLFAAGNAAALVDVILLCVLLTPVFMAIFVGATERKPQSGDGDAYSLTPFMATRPLTSTALVAAKLKMAARSTLAAWLLVLVAIPLALLLSGNAAMVINRARRAIDAFGTYRAVVFALLIFAALLASTWKQLVQSLYLGLSGREWVMKSSVFVGVALLISLGPVVLWIGEQRAVQVFLWNSFPWILAGLTGLKLGTAGWVAVRLYDSGLLRDRTLVAGAACWLLIVLMLHGVLVWLVATPYVPSYLLLLIAILATPLVRVSAAPLALAWNRHR